MNEDDRLLQQRDALLEAIYSAATHAEGWMKCLEVIARTFDGASAFRLASGPELKDVRSAGATLDPHYVSAYYERYAGSDPLTSRDRVVLAPPIVVEEALLPLRQFQQSEFFVDWMRPQGLGRIMRWRVQAPAGVMDLLVLRSESVGEFTKAEQQLSKSMLPHLSRAIEISDRMRGLESASQAALDRFSSAVILVDGARRVRFANRRAESLFGTEGLTVRHNRLYLDGRADQKFGELLFQATSRLNGHGARSGGIFALPRNFAPTPLSVAVSPLHEGERPVDPDPLALILITDPEDKLRVSIDGLRSLYDLTPTQARLLAALCTGASVSEVAASTGTSITTVKTHLAAIFIKTGERRQADLVLRIARDQALLST